MRQLEVMRAAMGLVLAAAMAAPAFADVGRTTELTVDAGLAHSDTGGAPRASLRYGIEFQPFEMEFEVARVQDEHDSLTTGFVNGVFNLDFSCCDRAPFIPYALVGVGYSSLDGTASDSGAAAQVALGSKFFLAEEREIALHLEGAYQRVDIDGLDGMYSIALGVTWRFE